MIRAWRIQSAATFHKKTAARMNRTAVLRFRVSRVLSGTGLGGLGFKRLLRLRDDGGEAAGIEADRKILSDLAITDAAAFSRGR